MNYKLNMMNVVQVKDDEWSSWMKVNEGYSHTLFLI